MGIFLGVHHVNVRAQDMENSLRFYTEMLGFSLISRFRAEGVELATLSLGGTLLEIKKADENAPGQDGIIDHLAIRTADIFAAFDWLKSQGFELITPEPRLIGSGEYILFFRGPSGEKIELIGSR